MISRIGAFLALTASVTPLSSWAQEGKATKIHFAFKSYYERIRPGYAEGIVDEDSTVILSNGNNVQETWVSSNQVANKTWNSSRTLGEGAWGVSGPHRLVKVERQLQSVRTTTIDVIGKHCTASWKIKLLAGYNEYKFYSIIVGQDAYYRQAHMVSSSCEIESN
jgi:hypothetical protein